MKNIGQGRQGEAGNGEINRPDGAEGLRNQNSHGMPFGGQTNGLRKHPRNNIGNQSQAHGCYYMGCNEVKKAEFKKFPEL